MSLCDSVIRKYKLIQSFDSHCVSYFISRSSMVRIIRYFINNITLLASTGNNVETNYSWNTSHYIADHRCADLIHCKNIRGNFFA